MLCISTPFSFSVVSAAAYRALVSAYRIKWRLKNAVSLMLQGFKRGQRLWTQKMLFSFAETSFSAAQKGAKRTGGAMVNNATNAMTAAGNSVAASACKTTSFGQPIAQENKPLHSSPRSTDAAAKPVVS